MKKDISSNLKKYKTVNPIKKFLLNRFLGEVEKIVFQLQPKTILDAGCGEGLVLKRLGEKIKFEKACGIDIESEVLKKAKRNFPTSRFEKGDVAKMRFKNNSFNIVIMLEVLEHLEDPIVAIKEAKRVSKKHCLFSVPNEPLFSFLSLLSGNYLTRLGRHPEHVNFWGSVEFKDLVERHFRNVKLSKSLPWSIVVAGK